MSNRRVIIAGGSGFIGFGLVGELLAHKYEPVVLSRKPGVNLGAKTVVWDGRDLGEWTKELEGAAAVINLSGQSVFGRWTPERRRAVKSSRVVSTRLIGQALAQAKSPPPAWINASAVGYYGHTGDALVDEESPSGSDYMAEVCREWEAAQDEAELPDTRKVRVRIGFVLGHNGGAFPLLYRLTRLFLGSAIGTGRQWVPWVHLRDLTSMFVSLIESDIAGVVNGVGPAPVRNSQLMAAMRKVVGRPWVPNVPVPILKLGEIFGLPPTDVAVCSSRVVSSVLPEMGFRYQFPTLKSALDDLVCDGVDWPVKPT